MYLTATPLTVIAPAQAPQQNVWIDKTGSTHGFAAYIAMIPGQRLSIVILANKNFPIEASVTAAWQVLSALKRAGMGCKPGSELPSACADATEGPPPSENKSVIDPPPRDALAGDECVPRCGHRKSR